MEMINQAFVMTCDDYKVQVMDWGKLTWFTCGELKNSKNITVGECRISVGQQNPRHLHTNCEEVLYVQHGTIVHSIGEEESVEMKSGDSIRIPNGVFHNAKNIGEDEAVMLICFSSENRQTVGE